MRLTISVLGVEVFSVSTETDHQHTDSGEATSYPMGFTPSHGDQRWEAGAQP